MRKYLRPFFNRWGYIIVFETVLLLFLLALPTVAFADDCLTDPFNAADCMRTPGFREALSTILVGLGVGPVVINNILKDLSGGKKLRDAMKDQGIKIDNQLRKQVQDAAKKIVATPPPPAGPAPPAPGPKPAPPPATPAPRWAGPIGDHIIDREKAIDILKQFKVDPKTTVWDAIQNLDPKAKDYWQQLDKIIEKAQDSNRRVKAITIKHKEDKDRNNIKGVKDDKEIVIVIEQPEYGPYYPKVTPTPPPKKVTPPPPKKSTPAPPPPKKSTPAPPPPKKSTPAPPPPKKSTPAPPPPKKPTPKPPDIWELRDKRIKELEKAKKDVQDIKRQQQDVARSYMKRFLKWNNTRRKAPIKGAVDVAKAFLAGTKGDPVGAMTTVGQAIQEQTDFSAECKKIRKEMLNDFQDFWKKTHDLEDAENELDLAKKAMKDVNKAMKELKEASPSFRRELERKGIKV